MAHPFSSRFLFGVPSSGKIALALFLAPSSVVWGQDATADADALAGLAIPELSIPAGLADQTKGVGNAARFVAVAQMRDGLSTPQELWQSQQLTAQDILALLESNDRLAPDERNEELQRDLAGILVNHAPELVKDDGKHKVNVRVALGRYYSSIGDVRTVDIAEQLLKELDQKPKSAEPWPQLWGVILLAQYHEKMGQWQKAGETWERALTYQENVGWWQAGVRIDAARAYLKVGGDDLKKKAEQLYAQVPGYGNGWDTIMSYYDHALPLINAGKLEEAKAILSQDLQVKENPEVGLIAQNAWLASLAYRQGNLDEALRYGQKVMELGEKTKLPHASSKGLYDLGRDIYNRAGGWKTQPIQSDVKELIIKTNPSQPDRPLYARFRIKTYGDNSVTATVDNPAVQVHILPVDNWQGIAHEEMEVIVQSTTRQCTEKVLLVLASQARESKTVMQLSFKPRIGN